MSRFLLLQGQGQDRVRSAKEQKLIEVLQPTADSNGLELVDVELSSSAQSRIIRVFLDKEGGLGIEDIAEANSWVDRIVEENEPFSGSYTLEVSSPGIDRPLRTLEHFIRFVGEEVRLLTESIDGRASWTGKLEEVDGSDVLLVIDGQTYRLPYEKIKKAHLKARIDFDKGKGQER